LREELVEIYEDLGVARLLLGQDRRAAPSNIAADFEDHWGNAPTFCDRCTTLRISE